MAEFILLNITRESVSETSDFLMIPLSEEICNFILELMTDGQRICLLDKNKISRTLLGCWIKGLVSGKSTLSVAMMRKLEAEPTIVSPLILESIICSFERVKANGEELSFLKRHLRHGIEFIAVHAFRSLCFSHAAPSAKDLLNMLGLIKMESWIKKNYIQGNSKQDSTYNEEYSPENLSLIVQRSRIIALVDRRGDNLYVERAENSGQNS